MGRDSFDDDGSDEALTGEELNWQRLWLDFNYSSLVANKKAWLNPLVLKGAFSLDVGFILSNISN